MAQNLLSRATRKASGDINDCHLLRLRTHKSCFKKKMFIITLLLWQHVLTLVQPECRHHQAPVSYPFVIFVYGQPHTNMDCIAYTTKLRKALVSAAVERIFWKNICRVMKLDYYIQSRRSSPCNSKRLSFHLHRLEAIIMYKYICWSFSFVIYMTKRILWICVYSNVSFSTFIGIIYSGIIMALFPGVFQGFSQALSC
jgi:membrane-associated HD superfamily phosphohydrolase